MDGLIHDLRWALRGMRRAPAFTAAATLTLALGIGANTAIFSVVDGVVLQPLPYGNSGELYTLHQVADSGRVSGFSVPSVLEWRRQQRSFEGLATTSARTAMTVTGRGEAAHVDVKEVSANLFEVLGVGPVIGRTFGPGDDQRGSERVAVLDHGYWRRAFEADPGVLGTTITINYTAYTIVGVMPADFSFPYPGGRGQDVFLPRVFTEAQETDAGYFREYPVVTLRAGVGPAQARQDGERINRHLLDTWPDASADMFPPGVEVTPLHERVVGDVQATLWLLFGGVSIVLLVAAVNVANLVMARKMSTRHELAVRVALGAGRARLVRQATAEMVLLAALGGGLGVVLSGWLLDAFLAVAPLDLPRLDQLALDGRVLLFTATVSLAVGLVLGIAPALRSHAALGAALGGANRRSSGDARHHRTLAVLVAGECALVFVLVIAAALLVTSFVNTLRVDPGFVSSGRLVVHLTLSDTRYPTSADIAGFYDRLLPEVRALAGVSAAGGTWSQALAGSGRIRLTPPRGEGSEADPGAVTETDFNAVTPGFFEASGVGFLEGRDFSLADHAADVDVAIINHAFGEVLWPGESEFAGRRYTHDGGQTWINVVGVVADTRSGGLREAETPTEYWPQRRVPFAWPTMDLVIATELEDVETLATPVREVLHQIDPQQPIASIRSFDAMVLDSLRQERFELLLFGAFAAVALLLGAVGIYGVVSFLVSQRLFEIGVRMAFGARASDVLRSVVGRGVVPVACGIAFGIAAAAGVTRLMQGLLFGVDPLDPVIFSAVAALLLAVGLAAVIAPACRATRVDPVEVMRAD